MTAVTGAADEMVAAYNDGKSIRQIAKDTGENPGVVARILTRRGVQMRPRGRRTPDSNAAPADEAFTDRIIAAYEDGRSTRQIAKAEGWSPGGINYRLRRAGVSLRGRGCDNLPHKTAATEGGAE